MAVTVRVVFPLEVNGAPVEGPLQKLHAVWQHIDEQLLRDEVGAVTGGNVEEDHAYIEVGIVDISELDYTHTVITAAMRLLDWLGHYEEPELTP